MEEKLSDQGPGEGEREYGSLQRVVEDGGAETGKNYDSQRHGDAPEQFPARFGVQLPRFSSNCFQCHGRWLHSLVLPDWFWIVPTGILRHSVLLRENAAPRWS